MPSGQGCLPHDLLVNQICKLLAEKKKKKRQDIGWVMETKHTLQLVLAESILVLVEIEESFGDRRRRGLVVRVVVRLQIRVTQSVFDGDTLGRIEGKKFLKEVEREFVALGEEGLEGDLLLKGKGANVFPGPAGFDSVIVFHGWCAQDIQDQGQLVVVYASKLLFCDNCHLMAYSLSRGTRASRLASRPIYSQHSTRRWPLCTL